MKMMVKWAVPWQPIEAHTHLQLVEDPEPEHIWRGL